MKLPARIFALVVTVVGLGMARPAAAMPADTPWTTVRTIKDLMGEAAGAGQDIHLILVHGMRTSDRTTWDGFRARLCAHLGGQCRSETPPVRLTDRLILADTPPSADYMGEAVWADDGPNESSRHTASEKWMGSQPFVDHYRFPLRNGRFLIVDEINYWPMLFAFKCQFIVKEDVKLAGPDKTNIDFCSANDDTHFPWFSSAEQHGLESWTPLGGKAPLVNGWIKNPILDWGITDAVLTLGTLKDFTRETVRCAFADVAALRPSDFDASGGEAAPRSFHCAGQTLGAGPLPAANTRFVVMSHSLGAFVLMDTFAAAAGDANYYDADDNCRVGSASRRDDASSHRIASAATAATMQTNQSLCFILRNSDSLYFFANQFPLLELARTQGISEPTDDSPHTSALILWAETVSNAGETKQIVAFSDPGDILTFEVPKIEGAAVINAYPKNSNRWFGLFENPIDAHVNYLTSKDVLDAVFGQ